MIDFLDDNAGWVLIALFLLLISLAFWLWAPPDPKIAKCEAAGGVWLEHIYQAGKYQQDESMGCLKKDVMIILEK